MLSASGKCLTLSRFFSWGGGGMQYFVTEMWGSNYGINRVCKNAGCLFPCLYMYIVHRRHTRMKKQIQCHTCIKDVLGVYMQYVIRFVCTYMCTFYEIQNTCKVVFHRTQTIMPCQEIIFPA